MVAAASIVDVAAFVGVIGDRLAADADPFDLGVLSGPPSRRLRREGCDFIYVPRHAGDAAAPAAGDVALIWGRSFREDDTLVKHGDTEAALDAAHLDGKFTLARVGERHVELHTDRMGTGPCYYARQGAAVFFGTHLGALLAVLPRRAKLNDLGIAEQIFFRGQINEETHFSGVFRLPSGQYLDMRGPDPGGAVTNETKAAFDLRGLRGAPALDFTPEGLIEAADRSVTREHCGPDSAIMLSVGRDSLALALAEGAPRRAAVYGDWFSLDRVGGERRARRLGLPLVSFSHRDWDLNTYQPMISRLFGGSMGLNVTRSIVGYHAIRERIRLAMTGNLGGPVQGARKPPGEISANDAVLYQFSNFKDGTAARLFGEERDHLVALMEQRYRELTEVFPPLNARLALNMLSRQPGRVFMVKECFDWFVPLAHPFASRHFAAMVLNADPAKMSSRAASDEAIRRRLATYREPFWQRRLPLYRVAWLRSRLAGGRAIGTTYWPQVMERSRLELADFLTGHERLDAYLQTTWERRDGRRAAAPPRFLFAAGMAAAIREFGI